MPQQVQTNVENNFTRGLITEATGLNFPENAATLASNCEFTLIGDVIRRQGINTELNGSQNISTLTHNWATKNYVWNNPGGDGNSRLLVEQHGQVLWFYNIAISTVAAPLSTNLLTGTNGVVNLQPALGNTFDPTIECEFADGNGYLFVYHPNCDPAYVTFNASTLEVQTNSIPIQIRDLVGVLEPGVPISSRTNVLTTDHTYNLANQGWTSGNNWFTTAQNAFAPGTVGSVTFNVATGLTISNGDIMTAAGTDVLHTAPSFSSTSGASVTMTMSGTVTSYTSGTGVLVCNITSSSLSSNAWNFPNYGGNGTSFYSTGVYFGVNYPWQINSVNKGLISTWHTAEGNYPSNADVWWYFKDSTGIFNPGTTQPSVTLATSNAPQGHYILNAFNLDRNAAAGLTGINLVTTQGRPSSGAWFAGRVWYTGVNAFVQQSSDTGYYTWTENIYFSQIVQAGTTNFGLCFQDNDPTAEILNSLLPTDGGVITIVGSGTIHKLFPIQNGMLVFANNGVWFITGSQGIGFSADDYTITKISAVKTISGTSFVDVLGLPYFWNEEGIYRVQATQNGSLAVEPLTVGTILSFYNNIPLASKQFVRGAYDPIGYVIQWSYRSTMESGIANRYQMDSILNYNTYNKAFFPYTISSSASNQFIAGVNYISYPYIGNATPLPNFKYPYSSLNGTNNFWGIAEEYDPTYVDWGSLNYTSQFTTGYKLHGQGMRRFQVPYTYVFSRNNGYSAYNIQSAWDYGINFDSNRWSQPQFVELNDANSSMIIRRHRLRGSGRVVQLMFSSIPGVPFDFMGWALYENVDAGV